MQLTKKNILAVLKEQDGAIPFALLLRDFGGRHIKHELKRMLDDMAADGEIVIEAKRYREQEKNRTDARERLVVLIHKALEKPRMRRQTRPTKASVLRRVEAKKKRGSVKHMRNKPSIEE